ncbi:phospholipid-translocating ATPase [Lentinula aciculospora]|uniref:Phospholipid-transporting ATPase n=1 Tax=Lentinula aciculospora TaxID=153920 RepID=A0A9W9ABL9_9AGAR|nr:phospholipid-translocating ATPase [Lentinula aciculospora]
MTTMKTTGPTKSGISGIKAFARRIASFSVDDIFSRKRPAGPPRTIFVNQKLSADYFDPKKKNATVKKQYVYVTNQVISSKYTLVTFLPRNLLEQFRRVANIYFLGIAILQFFPMFATISPGVVILPLVIIIALTALKDAYEDFRRHQSDKRVNQTEVDVLSGSNWVNPNVTQGKSKTFVRGIIPKPRLRRKSAAGAATASVPPEPASEVKPVVDEDTTLAVSSDRRRRRSSHRLSFINPFFSSPDDEPYWKPALWEDVRVGDFVHITEGRPIPADILICATSDPENVAFVETKNLDGETNLKSRNAVPGLIHLRSPEACASAENSFKVMCDRPETNMYRLNAMVEMGQSENDDDASGKGTKYPVDLQTVLLRGTVLKNTDWVIGVVLFTGEDTKIVMNAGKTPSKRSRVERQMNPQVLINLALIGVMAVVCAVADSVLEKDYVNLNAPWLYSDDHPDDNPSANGGITWAFALLTFQDLVPISLYLSIEVVRTIQAIFIYLDKDIAYDRPGQPPQATQARSWNLSDDLGQIEYIFSDKTGTLTQNSMVFRQCSIGGKAYRGDPEVLTDGDDETQNKVSDSIELEKELQQNPITQHVPSSYSTDANSSRLDLSNSPSSSIPRTKTTNPRFRDTVLNSDIALACTESELTGPTAAHARTLNGFFSVLGLCHTVLASIDLLTGEIEYKAQSPDEAALVQAAADIGYIFLGRDREILSIRTPGSEIPERYELLHILEFSSARKRMSVIVRKMDEEGREGEAEGRIFLLSKGADNVIFERLRHGNDQLKEETERHLSEFANEGLRTLTLAYKTIGEEEYQSWSHRYQDAVIALDSREEKVEAIANEIEQDLRLLGATAIEDRLQDGVPEAIADLKRAGIKIWVATGDKLETAIAIGRSTNLIGPDSNIIVVRGSSKPVDQQLSNALERFFPDHKVEDRPPSRPPTPSRMHPLTRADTNVSSIVGGDNGERPGGFVLVVDGAALLHAFESEETKALLLKLGTLCEGVICCRVSPLQKALIVRLVKDGLKAMTLAIGDGANDVSMIQAADVGVGISGEEGLQAVNSSDYAIAQFRFLKKLLLVHGHWSYARNGIMILNFFYKNIVPTGILWWFQIYCAWSATFVMDYTYILFWNSLWTIAPVVGVGLFDRILDSEILMDLPELYHYGREKYWFSWRDFFLYMLDGIYQSVIIYFFIMFTYETISARHDGYSVDQYEWSTVTAVSGVLVSDIFTGMCASAWTWWLVFFVFIGIVVVWAFTFIYSALSPGYEFTNLWGFYYFLGASSYFWFGLIITFLLALAPRYLAKAYKASFIPDDIDIVRWIKKENPYFDFKHYDHHQSNPGIGLTEMKLRRRTSRLDSFVELASRRLSRASSIVTLDPPGGRTRPSVDLRSASRTDMSTGLVSVDRGFDFAAEDDGVAIRRIQTNLSERFSSRNMAVGEDGEKKGKRSKFLSLKRGFTKKNRTSE